MEPVRVELGERGYDVLFNENWREKVIAYAKLKALIISDKNVAPHHMDKWKRFFPEAETLVIPAGERSKSSNMLWNIYSFLVERKFSRDTLIIALGGGVIGDLAGYAAATYMRGVHLLQIPTSLMAMVDSSIGGKVGINHRLGKNLIGSYKQPLAVYIDFEHLKTLPRREWLCGLGEMIKYGFIDESINLDKLCESCERDETGDWRPIAEEIRKCVEIKSRIVASDELDEKDRRIVLNFGHTIGHALEVASNYRVFRHGEAVVAGMAGECFISYRRELLSREEFAWMVNILAKFPLPVENINIDKYIDSVHNSIVYDKKVQDGKIRFVLLKTRGETVLVNDLKWEEIEAGIRFTFRFIKNREG